MTKLLPTKNVGVFINSSFKTGYLYFNESIYLIQPTGNQTREHSISVLKNNVDSTYFDKCKFNNKLYSNIQHSF